MRIMLKTSVYEMLHKGKFIWIDLTKKKFNSKSNNGFEVKFSKIEFIGQLYVIDFNQWMGPTLDTVVPNWFLD